MKNLNKEQLLRIANFMKSNLVEYVLMLNAKTLKLLTIERLYMYIKVNVKLDRRIKL